MIDVKETEERIARNKLLLKKLEETYLRAYCPQAISEGTSYTDYDSIHGTKKEYRIEEYFSAKQRLLTIIELDREIIVTAGIEMNDDEYLSFLDTLEQKVKYLRIVKCYTQEKSAMILEISTRQLKRIEKKIKMSPQMSL